MTKKTQKPDTKNENKVVIPIVIGSDGFPVPKIESPTIRRFECTCPICLQEHATLQLTQKGTYLVQCSECKTILYLNSPVSMSLFRGLQKFYDVNPDIKEVMTMAIVENAPKSSEDM
jgi:hypothetical protein